jgi:hypothetical protein
LRLGGYFVANALDMPRFAVQTNNLETLFALLATADYLATASLRWCYRTLARAAWSR